MSQSLRDQILIITNHTDSHAEYISKLMDEEGIKNHLWFTNEFPDQNDFPISIRSDRSNISLRINEDIIDITRVKSIWWRRPEPPAFDRFEISEDEVKFSRREYNAYFHGMVRYLEDLPIYWISKPSLLSMANNKVEQLIRARNMGFLIPNTLISASIKDILSFIQDNGEGKTIFKVLTDPFINMDNPLDVKVDKPMIVKTTLIENHHLETIKNTVPVPSLFQEKIDKLYELRVTVIGDTVFAVKIDSQAQKETSLDWRNYSVPMRLEAYNLPRDISEGVLRYVKSYGLNFSALDFIVDDKGQYIFIENNSNGQFLFVDSLVKGIGQAEHLVRCLDEAKNL